MMHQNYYNKDIIERTVLTELYSQPGVINQHVQLVSPQRNEPVAFRSILMS